MQYRQLKSIGILALSLTGMSAADNVPGAPGYVNKRDSAWVDTSHATPGIGPDSSYSPSIPGSSLDSGKGPNAGSPGSLGSDSSGKAKKAKGAHAKKSKRKSGSTSSSTLPDMSMPDISTPGTSSPNTGSVLDTGSTTNGVGDGTGSLPGNSGSINGTGKIGE